MLEDPKAPVWVRYEFPEWCEERLERAFGERLEAEMAAALQPAATDIRVNTLAGHALGRGVRASRDADIEAEADPALALGPAGRRPPAAGDARGLHQRPDRDPGRGLAAGRPDGRSEARRAHRRFLRRAGGKTLALAAMMENKGKLVAMDVLKGRIERSATRIRRAGINNVERRDLSSERDPWVRRHAGGYDRVLIDAPCSGAGTWRRNPDAKWRLKPRISKSWSICRSASSTARRAW